LNNRDSVLSISGNLFLCWQCVSCSHWASWACAPKGKRPCHVVCSYEHLVPRLSIYSILVVDVHEFSFIDAYSEGRFSFVLLTLLLYLTAFVCLYW